MKQRSKLGVTILVLVALVAMISCKSAFQQQSLPGDITNFSGIHVAAPTAIGSATPALMVDSDGLSVLFEVRDAATPVVSVDDGGVLDMKAHAVTNIGAAGTDFDSSGGLALASDLDIAGLLQPSFADLTVSDGDTITPTVTVYSLDTSGAVTITLAASADEGQLLVLINDDANATIIADTNLASSDGNAITLTAADDIAVFIYQDAVWHELLLITDS